ncbi:tRNA pseudouridine(13) synthase TruD [PVC group bacterium]|nr:tRNA pseudouridine(13) synthase TruD [PVC group bacterium]
MSSVQYEQDISGSIKNRPEDFIVEELPLYDPSGDGEHLYLCVQKTGMTHELMTRLIAKEMEVNQRAIGSAGRKDCNAITTQLVSVHLPGEEDRIPTFSHEGIVVLWHARHSNKLRTGHLLGNRFDIRLRGIDPTRVTTLQKRLQILAQQGLPNFFGTQRFGNDQNNHLLGAAIITNRFEYLVEMILDGDEKHHQAAKSRDYKKALESWPLGNPLQQNILETLANGKNFREASKRISKSLQKLWVNALQSFIFNQTLRRRQTDGTWDKMINGDLAWKHDGGGRTFEVTAEDLASAELLERTTRIEVSPTGPLWGPKMRKPAGKVFEDELDDLSEFDVSDELQKNDRRLASGARRPLRVKVGNPSIGGGVDEHGGFIRVQFELPAGSYATVLIGEMLRIN